MVNSPFIRPYFLGGGWHRGGTLGSHEVNNKCDFSLITAKGTPLLLDISNTPTIDPNLDLGARPNLEITVEKNMLFTLYIHDVQAYKKPTTTTYLQKNRSPLAPHTKWFPYQL